MDLIQLLWAKKLNRWEQNEQIFAHHPLLFHLLDVSASAKALLKSGIGAKIAGSLGLDLQAAVKWLIFLAGLHDIGKLCAGFQFMWPEQAMELQAGGLSKPLGYKDYPHGVMTTVVLKHLLPELGMNRESASRVATILGGHHGRFPTIGQIQGAESRAVGLEKENWKKLRNDMFHRLAELIGILDLPIPTIPDNGPFFIQFAAFVCLADWIGSISKPGFFQFADSAIPANDYWEQVRPKATEILQRLHWVGLTPSEVPAEMKELFPFIEGKELYPVQAKVVEMKSLLRHPGLVIIEAPMGQGKTEAAMFLADVWSVNLRQSGCYFALPTQATSNQMFGRYCAFLNRRYQNQKVNMQLLHGHAALSAEFEILRKKDVFIPEPSLEGDGKTSTGLSETVFAAEWFTYKKRGLLAPFGVGTVDQALMAVLQTRHYYLRLFGLAGKTVIIDEVHAYDAYMTVHLKNLLCWLAALGCSVVLLSATLPKSRRLDLIEAFEQGLGLDVPLDFQEAGYPRCTWVGLEGRASYSVESGDGCRLNIEKVDGRLPGDSDTDFPLGRLLDDVLSDGGCAAVIVNTVNRAQDMYRALRKYFPNPDAGDGLPELDLFHARFTYRDRAEREARTIKRFGKTGPGVKRPRRAVLVATQVIEQSLDLDFDLMASDIAPVDLLLQRAGRLHRHERPRPGKLKGTPCFFLLRPEQEAPALQFGTGTEAVYERLILLKTWLMLKDKSGLVLPDDLEPLIEAVYESTDEPEFAGFEEEILLAQGEYMAGRQSREFQALVKAVPGPWDADFLESLVEDLAEDDPTASPTVSALTRLSGPSVNVVVLYGDERAPRLDPESRLIDLSEKPGHSLAQELLKRSLSLNHVGVVTELLRQNPPSGWALSAWLRYHRPLFLDPKGQARLGSYTLTYHADLGLVVTKERSDNGA